MKSISPNLNIMIKACEKASKVLIRDFGEIEKLQVSKKGPSDFVTNSDLKTEKILIQELKKAKPNYSILSEENGIEINKDKNNTYSKKEVKNSCTSITSSNSTDGVSSPSSTSSSSSSTVNSSTGFPFCSYPQQHKMESSQ